MIIKNLKINNYGAIKNADLQFQKGFNLISGANGQGKSHIIRALAYLVLNYTEGKIEDDVNWDSDSFAISTLINHNNIEYCIENSYKKKAEKKLTINQGDNKEVIDSSQDVTNALAKIFDPSYCKPALISFQGEMDIVSARPSERRDYLKKIYDLDFSKEIEYLQDELESLKSEEADIQKQLFALQNKDYNFNEIIDCSISENQYNLSKKDYDSLIKQKDNIESQIQLYEQMEKEILDYRAMLNDHENDIKDYDSRIQNNENQLQSVSDELESLKEEGTTELEQQLKSITLRRLPTFNNEEFEKLRNDLSDARYKLINIDSANLTLVKQGKCPTCKRDFHTSKIEEYQVEYDKQEKLVNDLLIKFNEMQEKKKLYDDTNEYNLNKEHEKKRIQQQIESVKNMAEQKRLSLNSQMASINMRLMEDEETKERKQQKSVEMRKKIQELEDSLPSMKPEISKSIETDLALLSKIINEYEITIETNKIRKEQNDKLEKQKALDEKHISELEKQLESKTSEINDHVASIKILRKDFPNYVIGTMKSDLEFGMNDLLDSAYSGRYNVKMIEDRSGLSIVYGKKDKDIRLASGAEKNMFNIGFKNSFNILAGLGVLILDEALNFADDSIATSVFNVIQMKIEEENLNQVFVITHKDSVKKLLLSEYNATGYQVQEGEISKLEN